MKKIQSILVTISIVLPSVTFAQSLEEYVSTTTRINDNMEVRILVKDLAARLAYDEAMNEGVENYNARKRELLNKDGDRYGAVALKRLMKFCAGDKTIKLYSKPDEDTCSYIKTLE